MSGEFKAQNYKTASQKWVDRQLVDLRIAVAHNTACISAIIDELANSMKPGHNSSATKQAESLYNKFMVFVAQSGYNLSQEEKTELITGLINYMKAKELD